MFINKQNNIILFVDNNFNKNFLTARSDARARSCSLALATQNSSIDISSYNIDTSEKTITSETSKEV